MSQSNDQYQECFIPANWQTSSIDSRKQIQFPSINMKKLLCQAKQLHNVNKPTSLKARTCFLQLPITKIPDVLQEPCTQQQDLLHEIHPFKAVQNSKNQTFQEYFKDHQIIYNKTRMYSRPSFELQEQTSRFKPISHLADFHQKLFKQLQINDNKNSPTHIAINDTFNSNFESGNLGIVYKKMQSIDRQYFLLLENDINTHGYASWFFFSVKSCGKGRVYFHILNFSKSLYLYKLGWKISIFSIGKYQQSNLRWFKGGRNIQVYSSGFEKRSGNFQNYYSLYFEYQFDENQTQVYFCMSIPYTYTKMIKSIQALSSQVQSDIHVQIIKNVYSISNNIIPIVLISKRQQSQSFIQIQNFRIASKKKIVLFMARQHPGEVVGSNLMEEIINLIKNQNIQARQLMENNTIVLIPMTNPDGVIHGNSRCNLAGLDLNRQWMKQSMKQVTPQTFFLRKFIWDIHQKVGIEYLIDLHGHSKKINYFFFCNRYADKFPSEYFPYLISKIDKRFDLGSCTFSTTVDKKNTLRNQLFQSGMKNCITVQNSYFGYNYEKMTRSYKNSDFKQIAQSIFKCLSFMLNQQKINPNISIQFGFSKQQIASQLKINRELLFKKNDKMINQQNIQSQSDPQGDIMKPQQMMKIYQECKQGLPHKRSEVSIKRKFKQKKNKQQKQKKQPMVLQSNKNDQVRKSEPGRYHKEKIREVPPVKNHKSQKKFQMGSDKKNLTSQKFRDPSLKPSGGLILSRKYSEKKQRIIKKTVLNINQLQSEQKSEKAQKQKQISEIPSNSVLNIMPTSTNYYKYINHQLTNNNSNKQRKNPTRLKTQVQQANIKKNVIVKNQNYQKIREERLKMFLNETLSIIIRVNNHQMVVNSQDKSNLFHQKGSVRASKSISKKIDSHRFLTQNATTESNSHIQIVNSRIQNLQKERKKFLSRSYRQQILKRKKILSVQQQASQNIKYKKFQNFVETQTPQQKKQAFNPLCSSVFYYFPVV